MGVCRKERRGRYCEKEVERERKEQQAAFTANSIVVIRCAVMSY